MISFKSEQEEFYMNVCHFPYFKLTNLLKMFGSCLVYCWANVGYVSEFLLKQQTQKNV